MPKIKNINVTESMITMPAMRTKDIGNGAKILVLKRNNDNSFLTCLERDGIRCNFANSSVEVDKRNGRLYKYVGKADGVYEDGSTFYRRVNVTSLVPTHKRVRSLSEKRKAR